MTQWQILHGDLFDSLPTLAAESIDACVTDPPYGIGFMGKEWDSFLPSVAAKKAGLRQYSTLPRWTGKWAREVLRVLKPGSHIVVCGAPRSFHRMTSGLEDAGFEIRDCLSWLYGQGFPKSLNVGDGRGTALKPSWEPCVLGRKPFKGNLVGNLGKHGTGALNIDRCRIWPSDIGENDLVVADGRWPANVVLDDEAAAMLDQQSGILTSGEYDGTKSGGQGNAFGYFAGGTFAPGHGDSGGASRFYYVAKPSREERDYGIYDLEPRTAGEATDREDGTAGLNSPRAGAGRTGGARNIHPTVKPVELMRWLVRLITPPNGKVLDPFTGSGTTGMACLYEQRHFVGCEREAEYIEIARRRIHAVAPLLAQEIA